MPAKVKYDPQVNASEVTQATLSAVDAEVMALAYEISGRVEQYIGDEMITASGAAGLMGSFQVTRHVASDGKSSSVRVGSLLPYASYVEFGTRPHFPPIRPLYLWVEKKLDVVAYGVSFKGGKAEYTGKTKRQFGPRSKSNVAQNERREAKIMQVARMVQRAIGKRGTRPRLYMAAALESLSLKFSRDENDRQGLQYKVNYADWLKTRKGAIKSRIQMTLGGE